MLHQIIFIEGKHGVILILLMFQEETLGNRAIHYEDLPTHPPKKRYFSDLMDRKYLNGPNKILLPHFSPEYMSYFKTNI